jgi:hypothetical protein
MRFKEPLSFRPRPDRRFDPVYQRVLKETIAADEDDRPLRRARGARLDEELRLHLWLDLLKHKGQVVDRELFASIYEGTRQQLLAPEVTERMDVVCAAWSQPEGRALWEQWAPPAEARNVAGYESAKAVLTVTAGMAETWLKHGRETLRGSTLARDTFSELSRKTSRGAQLPATGHLAVREYSAVTRAIKGVVDEETPLLLQEMCVGIVRELARLFPELPIGHRVSIDAQMGRSLDGAAERQHQR